MEISIPADDEGYVLLRCPKCGEKFKLAPTDIESDEVEDIYCPLCGLKIFGQMMFLNWRRLKY